MRRILYFIGAGTSKALARPSHPVPAMLDFISTCAQYISDPVILTTLMQLETYDPYPYTWRSPAAEQLAGKLLQQMRDTDATDDSTRKEFARALRERPSESIEALLDEVHDNADGGSSSSRDAAERFRFAIRRIFSLIGWSIDWVPLTSFLARQFAIADSSHVFVSFNYDLLLERGIQCVAERAIDVAGFYGFPIKWRTTGDIRSANGRYRTQVGILNSSGVCRGQPLVLKPHGSLNWLVPMRGHYSESMGDDLRQGRSAIIALDENGEFCYPPYHSLPSGDVLGCQEVLLPPDLSGGVEGAGMEMEPVIVPPRTAKQLDRPFLLETRKREEEAIAAADEVYILGWGLPESDTDQEQVIRRAVAKRRCSLDQVTAVNFHASAEYYGRVQDIFGVERSSFRAINSGFREFAGADPTPG